MKTQQWVLHGRYNPMETKVPITKPDSTHFLKNAAQRTGMSYINTQKAKVMAECTPAQEVAYNASQVT
jgi:hypothetical protein